MPFCLECGVKSTGSKFCGACGAKAPEAVNQSQIQPQAQQPAATRPPAAPAARAAPDIAASGLNCYGCNKPVVGTRSTACGKIWHVECLKCTHCPIMFTGPNKKPFYPFPTEGPDHLPYCEQHYLELANGACKTCGEAIADLTVCKVLDNSYHWKCYQCCVGPHEFKDGELTHLFEDNIYCSEHLAHQFLEKCDVCKEPIHDAYVEVHGKKLHHGCWTCRCGGKLKEGELPRLWKGEYLCPRCWQTEKDAEDARLHANRFKVGDRVHVEQPDGELWPGTISKVLGDGMYEVEYDNGEDGTMGGAGIPAKLISMIPEDHPDFDKSNGRWGKKGLAKFDGYANEDDELNAYIGEPFYPYLRLKPAAPEHRPEHINGGPIKAKFREQHLDNVVFERMFKMPKKDFKKLKQWRRDQLKLNFGLF